MEPKEGTEKWRKFNEFMSRYILHAGLWHSQHCAFVYYDEGVCNCECNENAKEIRIFMESFIYQTLETERLRIEKEVEKKKLPIPNQYGTAVNLNRFNEVIDEILSIIRPKI